jgi:hypothetical protein
MVPPSESVPNHTLPWSQGKIRFQRITLFKNLLETQRIVKEYQCYLILLVLLYPFSKCFDATADFPSNFTNAACVKEKDQNYQGITNSGVPRWN